MKTIVIAGASGFIGGHVIQHFQSQGWQIKTIGRSHADATWDDQPSLIRVIEGADAVVNLSGKSVNCRFTPKNIDELIQSRVGTTRAIGYAIAACKQPPKTWINASGASIYREVVTEPNSEDSPIDGDGTMAQVARLWEEALNDARTPHTRRIALRITLVLGTGGGVFPIFKRLVSLGQGGAQGSGEQSVSWIHITDLVRLITFILETETITGPVNAAAPDPLSNRAFMAELRGAMKFPFGIPAPASLIRLGTALLGVDSELILRGMNVVSQKAPQQGFTFQFGTASQAFGALVKEVS